MYVTKKNEKTVYLQLELFFLYYNHNMLHYNSSLNATIVQWYTQAEDLNFTRKSLKFCENNNLVVISNVLIVKNCQFIQLMNSTNY